MASGSHLRPRQGCFGSALNHQAELLFESDAATLRMALTALLNLLGATDADSLPAGQLFQVDRASFASSCSSSLATATTRHRRHRHRHRHRRHRRHRRHCPLPLPPAPC